MDIEFTFGMWVKISKNVIAFGNIEVGKLKFHYYKNLILVNDVDTDNIQESSMFYLMKK